MWQSILQNSQEQQAFTALLDEYFARPYPTSAQPPSTAPAHPPAVSPALPTRAAAPPFTARAGSSYGAQGGGVQAPSKDEGPRRPAGLSSSRTTAGGFDATSGKSFAKGVFSSKGPMNRAEMEKQKNVGPLYVKPSTSSKPQPPPPRRAVATSPAAPDEERVRVVYDYEGAEAEDLPAREGEELVVVEHVSADWLRCRNSSGATGLIPSSYVEKL